jgi:hypothetical protein
MSGVAGAGISCANAPGVMVLTFGATRPFDSLRFRELFQERI